MSSNSHELQPEKWVELHADYLFNYASYRVNDDDLAKDIVQDTFLSGLKGVVNFKGNSSERTWLVSIIKRKIIDYYRKKNSAKGQAEIRMSFYESGENKGKWIEERSPQQWGDEADAAIERGELQKVIDWCIKNLPERYATVFIMKTVHKIETKEVCKVLDISMSNLWVMIHRARVQLQECITVNWYQA